MLEALAHDIRYALRTFARRPGFTAAALITLGLGIGANTSVFSVVNGILLRPLPYAQPDRLVAVWPDHFLSYHDLEHMRAHLDGLARLSGLVPGWNMTLTGSGEPAQLQGARPTADLFATLGVRAALGRTFTEEEGAPGANDVVVLSHAAWVTRFGADSTVVGRRLTLDGQPHTVVGVMPPEFELYQPGTEVWKPLAADPGAWYYRGGGLLGIGRLAPGADAAIARGQLRSLTEVMRGEFGYPDAYGSDADVVALGRAVAGDLRSTLLLLLAAVGFILLIAGANVANLLLARAAGRQREIAVRAALGAGRGRLLRQLLTESLVLSAGGGIVGLALAVWGVRLLGDLLPAGTPRAEAIAIDLRTLAACAAFALGTGLLFGLAPALTAAWRDLGRALAGGRGTDAAAGPGGGRVRSALVVGEVAIALVLSIGAGLMVRTLWRLARVEPGFRTERVLTLTTQATGPRLQAGPAKLAFYQELFERLGDLPGVADVGAIQHLPLDGGGWGADLDVEGQPLAAGATPPRAGWRVIGGDYFRALGIPLLAGRSFGPEDRPGSSPVLIVNRRLARQLWPGDSPLGKRINAGNATGGEWATVVGVVGDVRHNSLRGEPVPEIYRPLTQYPHGGMTMVVSTSVEPLELARPASQTIWAVDPDVPITAVRSMDQVVHASVARPRLVMTLLAAFAAVGLALGAVGIYGVISYTVAQRTREIGLRMALGADAGAVIRRVLWQGLGYAAVGALIGGLSALVLARALSGLLFGVRAYDPLTFGVLVPFIIIVAGLSCLPPARRAARLDPMAALRQE